MNQNFKKRFQRTNRHRKMLTSLVMGEMKIKVRMSYQNLPENLSIPGVSEARSTRDSHIAGEKVNL